MIVEMERYPRLARLQKTGLESLTVILNVSSLAIGAMDAM